MPFVKKTVALLVCLVLVCLCVSCSSEQNAEETTTESEVYETGTLTAVMTTRPTTTSKNTTTTKAPEPSLEPTKSELETLCSIVQGAAFFNADYSSETDNVLDFLYDGGLLFELLNAEDLGILVDGKNMERCYGNPKEGRVTGKDDPLGHFKNQNYIRVDANVLNKYMEQTFCNTEYKSHTISYDDEGNVEYYLKDGQYYFYWEISGMEGVDWRVGDCTTIDGNMFVTIDEFSVEPGEENSAEKICTVSFDAVLHNVGGKRVWSVRGSKISYQNPDWMIDPEEAEEP